MKKDFINKMILNIMIILFVILIFLFISLYSVSINGGVGMNVTVATYLNVGSVAPEVLNVSVNNGAQVILTANTTKLVSCLALARDYNNDTDIVGAYGVFFNSTYSSSDDNNDHYTNTSCSINYTFDSWNGVSDTNYTALVNCSFYLWYYSNPGNWNCSITVNDSTNSNATGSNNVSVGELLAVGLPESINYGTVNSTYVSNENITNVTNYGNVRINLSLSGYAVTPGDNLSMNCSYGYTQNISIQYEKFNLTTTTAGALSLSQFESVYTNLTSNPIVKKFDLDYRKDDVINEATNSTYWRIYVPLGVAGSCTGNIVFGATKSSGT